MKSNLNIRTILVIAIIGIISFVFFNNSLAANTLKVDVAVANIRESADANSTIIEQAARNEEVEILEKAEEWYKVKYNNKIGYVRKDLLEGETATTTEPTTPATPAETPETNSTPVETPTMPETPATVTETPVETPTPVAETPAETTTAENTASAPVETKVEETTGAYKCKEVLKVKIIPLINGYDIKELQLGAKISVLEINNKWALIESEGTRGWVLTSKIEKETAIQSADTVTTPVTPEQPAETTPVDTPTETPAATTPETPKTEEPAQPAIVEKTMYVNSNVINLRSAETTNSESLDQLKKATQVTVVSENNGWSKVKVNGKEGYILSTLLSERKPEVTTSRSAEEPRKQTTTTETKKTETKATTQATTKTETPKTESAPASTGSATGAAIVAKAKTYIGCKYVYGGTSPSGFDCSGFAQYIYKQFGISLNRTAAAQYSNGTAVSRGNLQVGDLVMFGSSASNINHVGIYAGNGQIVHAANKQRGVTIDTINSGYYNTHYVGARRIIK